MGNTCKQPKVLRKRFYFNVDEEQNNCPNGFNNMKSKIKLEFSLENCQKKSRYQIFAKFTDGLSPPFSSEKILSESNFIVFNTCLICDYFFEKTQTLSVTLMKDSALIGTKNIVLGNIAGSPGSTFKTLIGDNISIIVSAQSISDNKSDVEFDFEVKKIKNVDFRETKNKISYLITSGGRKVYSSESISSRGAFDKARIPAALLQNGFSVIFLNSIQESIGYRDEPNIDSFTYPNNQIYLHLVQDKKSLFNIYNQSKLIKNFNFIDYIRNGVTIKLTIGIDYTSSNKAPNDPLSLHYLGGSNDYEKAIVACGMVVAYYDYNQLFPVYGFGAVLKGENVPNMCFNVNFQENPEIYTIENVINAYRNSFDNLYLAGPTNFCPMIKKAIERIKIENDPLKYHILLILTDGIIYDMDETVDALVEASFLPLSVIIIGIGNDHFREMIELDGDDNPLISSAGVKRMRDIVQFVPFNKYKYDPNKLAEQVLEEVPRQIIEYYTMNHIEPDDLKNRAMYPQNFNNNF